jgi:hypothetical protein
MSEQRELQHAYQDEARKSAYPGTVGSAGCARGGHVFDRSDPRDEPADERAVDARNAATQAFLARAADERALREIERARETHR